MSEHESNDGENDIDDQGVRAAAEPTAISTPYKVLGDIANEDTGIGVLGRNTTGSGTTKGVEGRVDSSTGYGLFTPDDARVEGDIDTDSDGMRLLVDGRRVLSLGDESGSDAGNVVAGHSVNYVNPSAVGATLAGGGESNGLRNRIFDDYGTISGGKDNQAGDDDASDDPSTADLATVGGGFSNLANAKSGTIGGGVQNEASGDSGTVGGGRFNQAGGYSSTVGGGRENYAHADYATIAGGGPTDAANTETSNNQVYDEYGTIGGGGENRAGSDDGDAENAHYATVPGGRENKADGAYSFCAGHRAEAGGNEGAFVWGDSSLSTVTASAADEVRFQAGGGFVVVDTQSISFANGLPSGSGDSVGIDGSGNLVNTASSSARVKSDIEAFGPTPGDLLELVPKTFTYDDTGEEDLGLVAEEVAETMPALVTTDDRGRPRGVKYDRLPAVLIPEVKENRDRIDDLERAGGRTDRRIAELEAENEALRERLAALEAEVAGEAGTGAQPAGD